jgi:hypothetical protein
MLIVMGRNDFYTADAVLAETHACGGKEKERVSTEDRREFVLFIYASEEQPRLISPSPGPLHVRLKCVGLYCSCGADACGTLSFGNLLRADNDSE